MPPFRILTVCLGNLCRSPLAERLLAARLAQATPVGVVVSSAGVAAPVGRAMEPTAAAELARLGGSSDGFAARRLAPAAVGEADLVLAATRDIRTTVLREQPRAMRRTFTLGEFAAICGSQPAAEADLQDAPALVAFAAAHRHLGADPSLDLVDPIGQPPEVHRQVADVIDGQVRAIVERLGPLLRS